MSDNSVGQEESDHHSVSVVPTLESISANSDGPLLQNNNTSNVSAYKQAVNFLEDAQIVRHHFFTHELERRDIPLPHRLHSIAEGHSLHRYAGHSFGVPFIPPSEDSKSPYRRHALLREDSDGPDPLQVSAFCRMVNDETEPVFNIPHDVEIPLCHCNHHCKLVKYTDVQNPYVDADQYTNKAYEMWACNLGACMMWKIFREASTSDVGHAESDASIIPGESTDNTIEAFWQRAGANMTLPDKEFAQLISNQMAIPNCACNNPADIAICKLTGDIFFVCAERTCPYVQFAQTRPTIQDIDVGQYIIMGAATIDRYTTVQNMMRWFGMTFSTGWWKKLSKAPKGEFPLGSFPMQEGSQYDAFISYRGASGRFFIWLTLCSWQNMLPAFIYTLCLLPIVVVILFFTIFEPCGPPGKDQTTEDARVPSILCSVCVDHPSLGNDDLQCKRWFVFRPYATVLLMLIILFWHPIMAFYRFNYKIFIDKYCICQSDVSLCTKGVTRLPLYLKSSKVLYCLFDHEWTTRMWCVWELAVYLKLRENPKVKFLSISALFSNTALVVLINLFRLFYLIVTQALASCSSSLCIKLDNSILLVIELSVSSIEFILFQAHFRNLEKLRNTIKTYDIREAQLHSEDDRKVLLRLVDELFREGASSAGSAVTPGDSPAAPSPEFGSNLGIDNFNRAVRSKVPEQLPVTGLRSLCVLSYIPTVLLYSVNTFYGSSIYDNYDLWAYGRADSLDFTTAIEGFRTILSFSWDHFIALPFSLYTRTVLVFLFLWLQKIVMKHFPKVSYWHTVIIAMPIFLVLECVFAFRSQAVNIMRSITVWGCISGREGSKQVPFIYLQEDFDNDFDKEPKNFDENIRNYYVAVFNWLFGIVFLFNRDDQPDWDLIYFQRETWIDCILWAFLVTPVTLFVLYIFEPEDSIRFRRKLTEELLEKYWYKKEDRDPRPTIGAHTMSSFLESEYEYYQKGQQQPLPIVGTHTIISSLNSQDDCVPMVGNSQPEPARRSTKNTISPNSAQQEEGVGKSPVITEYGKRRASKNVVHEGEAVDENETSPMNRNKV